MNAKPLTHIDLFSGIGGFALACQWAGIKTEVFCEKDERCRSFLGRTYPGVPIIRDVREFNGREWGGRFLLTGGVPCQPASRAGKQRGKGDDRWLWGEAVRVVAEAKPRWCLFENPPGIYDVGLDGILADLEGAGYEVGTVEIPACAVNSPQIRQRVWIVAHASQGRQQSRVSGREEFLEGPRPRGNAEQCASSGHMAHSTKPGHQGAGSERGQETGQQLSAECGQGDLADTEGRGLGIDRGAPGSAGYADECDQGHMADTARLRWKERGTDNTTESERGKSRDGVNELRSSHWDSYVWVPCADGKLRRAPDDSQRMANGLPMELLEELAKEMSDHIFKEGAKGDHYTPHRSILAALGNSIVPAVAYQVIKAIKDTHEATASER